MVKTETMSCPVCEARESLLKSYEEALRAIQALRESWYDAMGDDEAGLPNDEAEEAWDIAIAALERSSSLVPANEETAE